VLWRWWWWWWWWLSYFDLYFGLSGACLEVVVVVVVVWVIYILPCTYGLKQEIGNIPGQYRTLKWRICLQGPGHAEPPPPMCSTIDMTQEPIEFQFDQQHIWRTSWLITQQIPNMGQFDVLHLYCILPH
jgi:hypothetical protein